MNLKLSLKDGRECQKLLTVEIMGDRVREEYDRFYQAIAPKAKIPGFRPGKASREVLEMHFGQEAKQEVLKNLISESYGQALQEKALEPLGYPEIKDVQFEDQRLTYQACIEIRPKIKLSKVTGLKAKKETAEIKPEEIEESLKRMQESLAQYKAVEDRPIARGDFVIADYVCSADGKEIEKRDGDWFEIKEDEFLKGFSGQLIGGRPGEDREVRITFPEDFGRKEFAGKEAVFQVRLKEIKQKILPEINDQMAQAAGDHKTLEELKEKLRSNLLARKEQEKEAEFERALLDELLKHNKIELPQGVVQKRFEYLRERAVESSKQRGLPEDQVETLKGQMKEELEKEARRQVHLAFLLDEISTREHMVATEGDLKTRYEAIARQFRKSAEEIEKYYREHEPAKEALCDQIRNDKAVEFLKKNAKQR